jgi:6-pyruvoyltetrahydropterin/6-carboxytetrahydropterin synthase
MMIAHSFAGEEFGPAQNVMHFGCLHGREVARTPPPDQSFCPRLVAAQMHGATYTVDCEFTCGELVPKSNWVVDIGAASEALKGVLAKYNYRNLDELPEFAGQNTTTEFMCKQVFDGLCAAFAGKFSGRIKVVLAESHTAWASFSGAVGV